jgi:hypothetical protein
VARVARAVLQALVVRADEAADERKKLGVPHAHPAATGEHNDIYHAVTQSGAPKGLLHREARPAQRSGGQAQSDPGTIDCVG